VCRELRSVGNSIKMRPSTPENCRSQDPAQWVEQPNETGFHKEDALRVVRLRFAIGVA
jgi:hypothetical protein